MTMLEDRLRSTLLATPTPTASTVDPLADLERRVGRARTRWATAGVTAVAVVIAAIVVPLSLAGRSATHRSTPAPAAPKVLTAATLQALAVGDDGAVWTLTGTGRRRYVEKRDPGTGKSSKRYPVPSYMQSLAFAGGEVWVWGDHGSAASLEAINATTGAVAIRPLTAGLDRANVGRGQPFAAVGQYLVVVKAGGRSVAAFRVVDGRIETRSIGHRIQFSSLVTAYEDEALISNGHRGTAIWDPAPASTPNHSAVPPLADGLPLAQTVDGIWTATGGGELYGSALVHLIDQTQTGGDALATITAPRAAGGARAPYAEPYAVVVDRIGGLYVGFSRGATSEAQASYLAYYSPKALAARSPIPTAVAANADARDLSLDSAGGVVYLKAASNSANGAVTRWNPVAARTAKPRSTGKIAPTLWSDHLALSETVASDGSVWTLSGSGSGSGPGNSSLSVEKHDPSSGQVTTKYAAPAWAQWIYATGDQIWVWGGGVDDGRYGRVEAIDQQTGAHVARDLGHAAIMGISDPGYPVVADGNSLLALLFEQQTIAEFSVSGSRIVRHDLTAKVLNADDQLFADNGVYFVVTNALYRATRFAVPEANHGVAPGTAKLGGPPLAAGAAGIWIDHLASHNTVMLENVEGRPLGKSFLAPESSNGSDLPVQGAVDSVGGLYVGWAPTENHAGNLLAYYSPSALKAKHPVPTATLNGPAMYDLAPDSAGGVVFLQGEPGAYSTLARWNPTGS